MGGITSLAIYFRPLDPAFVFEGPRRTVFFLAGAGAVDERLLLAADFGLGFTAFPANGDTGEKTFLAPPTAPLVFATINPTVVPTFSAMEFNTGFPFALAMGSSHQTEEVRASY